MMPVLDPSNCRTHIKIGAGGGTRTEIKAFYKIHYSVITRQLPRKNHFITHGHQ